MNRVMIDPAADTPRVIVVERRSLLSQIGGVWFVALPLIAAYLICRVPYVDSESSPAQLHLGDNSWQYAAAPVVNRAQPHVEHAKAVTVAAESSPNREPGPSTSTAEAPRPAQVDEPAPPAEPAAEKLPMGVVVIESPKAGVNPVAVFDPEGKALQNGEPPQAENRTLEAALKFDGGQPTGAETRQALEEINAAAEKARMDRERTESLKPLIEIHEKAQTEAREAKKAEAQRRQAAATREAFLGGLGTVLASDSSIPQQGRQIDLMVRRELDLIDFGPFQTIFKKLTTMRASRASKLRYLVNQNVPESLILSYLIELDSKEIGKTGGPRDRDHAIVRSAQLLLSNVKGN